MSLGHAYCMTYTEIENTLKQFEIYGRQLIVLDIQFLEHIESIKRVFVYIFDVPIAEVQHFQAFETSEHIGEQCSEFVMRDVEKSEMSEVIERVSSAQVIDLIVR